MFSTLQPGQECFASLETDFANMPLPPGSVKTTPQSWPIFSNPRPEAVTQIDHVDVPQLCL